MTVLIVNQNDELERYFADFQIELSNGLLFKDSFWDHSKIPFLTFDQLAQWKSPRKVKVTCKIGYYYGIHDGNAEWQSMLTEIDDFLTVVSVPSSFTQRRENIFEEKEFTDVTIICEDEIEIKAHKQFLISSPFFLSYVRFASVNEDIVVYLPAESKIVRILMGFLYSGIIREKQDVNWKDLYVLAMYCNLWYLANQCQLLCQAQQTSVYG